MSSLHISSRTTLRGAGFVFIAVLIAVSPALPGPAAAEDPPPPGTVTTEPAPTDPTPVDPTPVDPTPVDPTPVDPTPVDPTPVEPLAYAPQPGPMFNNPGGTREEQYAINRYLVAAIDNTPPGATLRIALFSGSIPSFRDAVINAYRRGVHVRMVIDGHSSTGEWWTEMVKAIGTDRSGASFTVVCSHGCFDTRVTTLQHSKLYLFSSTGTARRVSMIGSGNPTYTQAQMGWNDLFTLVDDQTMYDGYVAYFDAMVRSASTSDEVDYYRQITSGKYTTVLSPAQHSSTPDYYTRVLDNIRCTAAPGSGVNGHTKVTIAMGLWSPGRIAYAKKLWQLDEAGCVVEAIVSSHNLDSGVLGWLRKSGRNHGITFKAASLDFNHDNKVDRYLHEKIVMVSGGYLTNQAARISFMGSHNFTYNAFRGNNDIILQVKDRGVYDQLEAHMQQLRSDTVSVPHIGSSQVVAPEADLTQNLSNLESLRAYGD